MRSGAGLESPVLARVRELITPITSDLGLDLYDLEQRGGTLRVTLDTPPGSRGGITLDDLALASRLVARELDHHDPIPARYTLEVTSPGVERALRVPAHFQREVGKVVAIRLADVGHDDRRITGTLVASDDTTATVRVDGPEGPTERTVSLDQIDRAKTVFVWPVAAQPGKRKGTRSPSTGPVAEPSPIPPTATPPGSRPSPTRVAAARVRAAARRASASEPTGKGARGRSPLDKKEHSS